MYIDLHSYTKTDPLPHLVMLNKVHKRCPLHLHRLAMSVIECQDKVEEVGLAEVGGGLLLEMSSGKSDSTENTTGKDSQLLSTRLTTSVQCFF